MADAKRQTSQNRGTARLRTLPRKESDSKQSVTWYVINRNEANKAKLPTEICQWLEDAYMDGKSYTFFQCEKTGSTYTANFGKENKLSVDKKPFAQLERVEEDQIDQLPANAQLPHTPDKNERNPNTMTVTERKPLSWCVKNETGDLSKLPEEISQILETAYLEGNISVTFSKTGSKYTASFLKDFKLYVDKKPYVELERVCEERQLEKTKNTAANRGQSPQTDKNKPNVTKSDGAHPVKSLGPASISNKVTTLGSEMVNRERRLSTKMAKKMDSDESSDDSQPNKFNNNWDDPKVDFIDFVGLSLQDNQIPVPRKADRTVSPTKGGAVSPTTDEAVASKTDEAVASDTDGAVSPTTDGTVDPATDEAVSPITDEAVVPNTEGNMQVVDGGISNTVEVRGFSMKTSQELMEMYFENSRRSGGGDLEEVKISDEVAYITFKEAEVAQKVASRSNHQLDGHTLTVTLFQPLPPKPCYQNKVLIQGVNNAITEELLRNFLETKTKAQVTEFLYGEEDGNVVVTLSDNIDIVQLEKIFQESSIQGVFLKAARVAISNCILVQNLHTSTSHDVILYYFENKRRSGGGDVERVEMKTEERYCLIYFEDPSGIYTHM